MKTKFFLIAAMAAMFSMSFTACSNSDEEMAGIAQTRAGISFDVHADGPAHVTRGYATTAANATATIASFQTWAYDDVTNGIYMGVDANTGRTVSNTGTALAPVWTYTPEQFWPVNALNFVAVTPAAAPTGGTLTHAAASATNVVTLTTNYTAPTDVENQVDLMYAEADGITKDGADATPSTGDDGNVPFTFKHALSQIVFKGKFSDNGAITKATVAEISLCNVYKTGVIPFTSEGNFYGGTALSPVTKVAAGNLSNKVNFTLAGSDLEDLETIGNGIYTLAAQDDDPFWMTTSENSTLNNAWFMLPQAVAEWDGTTVNGSGVPNDGGSYIKLRVKLEKDGVVIKDNQEADAVYLPLSIDWDRSKKYIYTIQFNGANALTPITFSVAAENWTDADPQPGVINM